MNLNGKLNPSLSDKAQKAAKALHLAKPCMGVDPRPWLDKVAQACKDFRLNGAQVQEFLKLAGVDD